MLSYLQLYMHVCMYAFSYFTQFAAFLFFRTFHGVNTFQMLHVCVFNYLSVYSEILCVLTCINCIFLFTKYKMYALTLP